MKCRANIWGIIGKMNFADTRT